MSRTRHTSIGGYDPPIVRADSAKEVSPKRRATGRSPSWSREDQVRGEQNMSNVMSLQEWGMKVRIQLFLLIEAHGMQVLLVTGEPI